MIEKKIERVYNAVRMVGFHTALNWHDELNCEYYHYFNSTDEKVRAGSTFAFLGMLMNWYNKSCFAFHPDTGMEVKDCYNHFKPYLEEFLNNSNSIAKEFPEMHYHIVHALYELDVEENFENAFPHIDLNLFERMKNELFSDDMVIVQMKNYEGLLNEVGLDSGYF